MQRKPTKKSLKLPAIVGDSWINSGPPGPDDLAGKVVLVDFWTYTCANCLRTIPYLKMWWEKYRDIGLLIVGIHAPEFEFEKDQQNVEDAVGELGIGWPVVLDNKFVNWHNFANHYWPAKYLADRKGKLVYEHFGEGAFGQTERKIQDLLMEQPGAGPMPEVETEHVHRKCFKPTPEIYCGHSRGAIGNEGGYIYGGAASYDAPTALVEDTIALSGSFIATPECVESAEAGATLMLSFTATEVNLVMRTGDDAAVVEVKFNGHELDESSRGSDVTPDSEVRIVRPRMYNLLKINEPLRGHMTISAKEGDFQAYAFTFSGCVD